MVGTGEAGGRRGERGGGPKASSASRRVEWPTIAVAAAIYGTWAAATAFHAHIPTPLLMALGGWLVAWHGSLQHEAIHGHPTPWARVNAAIAFPPLALWLPYPVYGRSHLAHHASEHLAHPAFDPEARYLPTGRGRVHGLRRIVATVQATLAGRILLGPVFEVVGFLAVESRRALHGEGDACKVWAQHALAVGAVLGWLHVVDLGLIEYLACFVYPGVALSLIRSFAEHRAASRPGHRVAIVENAPILGLLFLNNNLHAVHHAWPGLSWWRLPERYRQRREEILAANGGLVYAGYGQVFARFLFRPHDAVEHPEGALPGGAAA